MNKKKPPKIERFWWEGVDSNHRRRQPADLQSAPFSHLGTLPCFKWSWWTDLNPRPADYKSAALPTELHQLEANDRYNNKGTVFCQDLLFIKESVNVLHFLLISCFPYFFARSLYIYTKQFCIAINT